jgi:rare lipoprotein A
MRFFTAVCPAIPRPQLSAGLRLAVPAIVATVALAGCGETRTGEAPPQAATPAPAFTPGSSADPGFKIGRPYAINGVWYRPGVDWAYEEEGIASWYGSEFHGRSTANGELFDMHQMTAAHRTLPLPSIVQVTNLENGRSVRLRVNDRGPFAHERIIDVSKMAAKQLGFYDKGTARVRVRLIADESMRLAGLLPAAARSNAVAEPATGSLVAVAVPVAATAGARTGDGAADTAAQSFIQAGAFADHDNASRAGLRLIHLAPVVITYGGLDGRNLYRVRLGPLSSASAERVLAEVIRAGYSGSRVVME